VPKPQESQVLDLGLKCSPSIQGETVILSFFLELIFRSFRRVLDLDCFYLAWVACESGVERVDKTSSFGTIECGD